MKEYSLVSDPKIIICSYCEAGKYSEIRAGGVFIIRGSSVPSEDPFSHPKPQFPYAPFEHENGEARNARQQMLNFSLAEVAPRQVQ